MARLIDAGWLLNAIEKLKVRNTSNTATIFDVLGVLDDVEKIIKAAPINEPVKHGHWIHGSSSENIRVTCSECGYKVNYFWDSWQDALHCPKCGARMDGDQNGI